MLRALEILYSSGGPWSEHISRFNRQPRVRPLIKIGLYWERELLYKRINERVDLMINEGLVEEVENLMKMGYDCTLHSMQSLGYRHICNYIKGAWKLKETLELLARDTRRYAKRQMTWFKKDKDIFWVMPDQQSQILNLVQETLRRSFQ